MTRIIPTDRCAAEAAEVYNHFHSVRDHLRQNKRLDTPSATAKLRSYLKHAQTVQNECPAEYCGGFLVPAAKKFLDVLNREPDQGEGALLVLFLWGKTKSAEAKPFFQRRSIGPSYRTCREKYADDVRRLKPRGVKTWLPFDLDLDTYADEE